MTSDYQILRTAALELQTLDPKQVVKTAGVVSRIKNWFKKITNPEYRSKLQSFHKNTKETQELIDKLNKSLDKIQEDIKDGNLESYNNTFDEVKELALKLYSNLSRVGKDGNTVSKIMFHYTKEEMSEPGFEGKVKAHLPEEYDIEWNKVYKLPLKSFNWYSNLDPEDIAIRRQDKGALTVLLAKVAEAIKEDGRASGEEVKEYLMNNLEEFLNNYRKAIVDGVLIMAGPKDPSSKIQRIQAGQSLITVTTAPFLVPGKGIMLQATVKLIDNKTSLSSRDKLSIRSTSDVTVLNRTAKAVERINQLKKLAQSSQELPYQVTQLSEVELATVLREGYKQAFGTDPTAEALAGGWAQVILESGRPVKLPNNNVGNIKATDDWVKSGNPYFVKSTEEYTKDGKHFIHKGAKWRAYPTPVDGAAGYWKLLGNRYRSAMDWMAAGDPRSATVALGMKTYFTANIKKYSKGVESLYNEFMKKIAPQLPGLQSAPLPPPAERPELKDWVSQYSEQEKQSVLKGPQTSAGQIAQKSAPVQVNLSPALQEADALLQELFAEDGKLTSAVKYALLKNKLPESKVLIAVEDTELNYNKKLSFAKKASDLLKEFIQADVSIHSDGEKIHLECTAVGQPLTVSNAALALCDCLAVVTNSKTGSSIFNIAAPNLSSTYRKIIQG